MINTIKKTLLVLLFELSEYLLNFYENIRSLVSLKSYFLLLQQDLINLIKFNKKNIFHKSKKNKFILIDVFFNYSWIISNSIIAAEYAKKYDLQLASYNSQPGGYRRNPVLNSIFNSIGCNKHYKVKLKILDKIRRIKLFFNVLASIKNKNDLFNLKIYEIWVGVDIYESILRGNLPTVKIESIVTKKYIYKSIKYFIFFDNLFKQKKIAALFISHDTYISMGIPMKLAFHYKIPVFFANAREIVQVEKPHQLYFRFNKYKQYFDSLKSDIKEKAILIAKKKLEQRLSGILKIDMDYQEKSAFEKKFISQQIINNNKEKILITTHCFFDNPHCYGGMLFTDFYEWLNFLAQKSQTTDYDWYIKPHRDYLPGTLEVLEKFIPKFKNLKIINPETSFHQLKQEGIKNVLTCYGSVGHELPLLGFNVINAGYNPHIKYNFNMNCLSISQYSKVINEIKDLKININFEDIFKFYYVHNIIINGDMFSNDGIKKSNSILKFKDKEFIKVFLSNKNYYNFFKKNMSNFISFESIYSWEYFYNAIDDFEFEKKKNSIVN